MTTTRHPNRTGLRAVTGRPESDGSAPAGTSALACRCPARVVAGAVWAYDVRLGWHDPAEHDTWTPPRRPWRGRLPEVLQSWTTPTSTPAPPGPACRRGCAGGSPAPTPVPTRPASPSATPTGRAA